MKRFYLLLLVIAVAGVAAIYVAGGRGDSGSRAALPIAPGDTLPMPGWTAGSDSAPVEVEEYADFECPYCAQFAVLTLPDVMQRLVQTGRVRWRFHDYVIPGHTKSPLAHEAAACAGEQGKFWEMHDHLYFNQNRWVEARNTGRLLRDYAQQVGLDMDRYDACVQGHKYLSRIQASGRQGSARGVNSTPTLIIAGIIIKTVPPYDSLKALIEKATPKKKS